MTKPGTPTITRARALSAAVMLLGASFGCGEPEVEGAAEPTGQPDALVVNVELSSPSVAQGQEFTAAVHVMNPTQQAVELEWAGCIMVPHVRLNGEDLPWKGTSIGCAEGMASHRVEPGQSLDVEFSLAALIGQPDAPLDYSVLPEPGTYEFAITSMAGFAEPSLEFEVTP